MITLKNQKTIEKEIEVVPYLTYAQIQNIVNAVCKFDTWADREQNIDILLLHYATNLTDKEIEEHGHVALLQSGIIDEVRNNVKNFNKIYEAINYTESVGKSLSAISKQLPKLFKEAMENASKSSKK